MNLYVIDVSAAVYTGDASKFYADRMHYGYPVGGIHYLMQQLCLPLFMHDDFVLCFDSPSFRCREDPGYKKGRTKNYRVISQLEVLYSQLNGCGIPCLKMEPYEADDLISWTIDELHDRYYEVSIIGNDHDLCHNIRDNVRFRSLSKNQNSVYPSSFSTSIEKGVFIKFNTISAYKALCGCRSDKVSAFTLESGLSGIALYNKFAEFCDLMGLTGIWQKTANPKALEIWARHSGLFTQNDLERLEKRIHIIYPAPRPDGTKIQTANFRTINKEAFERFATMFNVAEIFKSEAYRRVTLYESDIEYLRGLSNDFNSGRFCADRNIPFDKGRTAMHDMRIDCFTRDF